MIKFERKELGQRCSFCLSDKNSNLYVQSDGFVKNLSICNACFNSLINEVKKSIRNQKLKKEEE